MIYAMWNGGNGYGPSDLITDLEGFASMTAVRRALVARRDEGDTWRQGFEFVNREDEMVYCPCVDDTSSFWVWLAADGSAPDDGNVYVPEYPDVVVEFGPRGGAVVTPA